jgi:hypothetical protein
MTMEVQVDEIDLPIFFLKKTVKDTQILRVREKIDRFIGC